MKPVLLPQSDDVGLFGPFSAGRLLGLPLSTGELVPRYQRVIGWGVPCDVQSVLSGTDI